VTGKGTIKPLKDTILVEHEATAPVFFAQLYLGLWYELQGDLPNAQLYFRQAVASPYREIGHPTNPDYMWHVACVHMQVREWSCQDYDDDMDKNHEDL